MLGGGWIISRSRLAERIQVHLRLWSFEVRATLRVASAETTTRRVVATGNIIYLSIRFYPPRAEDFDVFVTSVLACSTHIARYVAWVDTHATEKR